MNVSVIVKYLRALRDIDVHEHTRFGAKAGNLGLLMREGYNVPGGFCLAASMYREAAARSPAMEEFLALPPHLQRERLSEIADIVRGFGLPGEARDEIDAVVGKSCGRVMVRSSAPGEDSAGYSFAGLFSSLSSDMSLDSICRAVTGVWASLWSLQAYIYREEHGMPQDRAEMAVIIQQEIEPVLSGVVFTRNPLTGGDEVVINAYQGEGSELVSGRVTPCACRINPGNELIPLDGHDMPAALPPVAGEIVALARSVEQLFEAPQDMEWVYDGEFLWILQARPLTTGPEVHWTREGLAEFLPERLSPLSADIGASFFDRRLRSLYGGLGLELPRQPFTRQWKGTLYLNGNLMEHISRQLHEPACASMHFERALKWMEAMRGELDDYRRDLERQVFRLKPSLPAETLLEHLRGLLRLMRERDPLLALTYLLAYLEKNLQELCRGEEWEFLRPCLEALPASAQGEWFPFQEMLLAFAEGSDGGRFHSRFGDWTPSPFELAGPRLRDDPSLLAPLLEKLQDGVMRAEWKRSIDGAAARRDGLQDMIGRAEKALHGKTSGSAPMIRSLLAWLSFLVNERERHRPYTYLATAHARTLAVRLADGMKQRKLVPQCFTRDDIFFFTISEIERALVHGSLHPGWLECIEARRNALNTPAEVPYEFSGARPRPVSTISPMAGRERSGITLQGGSVTAKARAVRSVRELALFQQGEILVVPDCEPFWSIVFPLAAGFLAEKGGLLSHMAILAREYGMPAVSSLMGIMGQVATGDMITIDGDRGVVVCHPTPPRPPGQPSRAGPCA